MKLMGINHKGYLVSAGLLGLLTLSGCSSFNDPGRGAWLSPATPIVQPAPTAATDAAPSKARFLSAQSPDVRKAYQLYQSTGKAPIIQTDEFLQFPFNQSQPIVNCQPLRACDIALQAGEKITGVFPGDTARWKYQVAQSGLGETAEPHLIFKPTDYNLSTNVVITTTKRTYYLALVSKPDSYVRQVKFWYPDEMQAQWNQVAQNLEDKAAHDQQTQVASLPNLDVAHLNFNYSISKPFLSTSPAWMPLRAFNDGKHVYLQMPANLGSTDAPALFVVNNSGTQALVNYRVRAGYYIVDLLFKQAVLVSGVGSLQQRVTITYNG